MSEFPETQPFGPSPAQHNQEPAKAKPATTPSTRVNITVVATAVAVGFAAGYLVSRYQQLIVSQTKLDQFISYAQDWIREQGPKITDPIKQGLESTGSTVEQAMKRVSASRPLESLNLFQRQKQRKFLGLPIF
jgi:hypothetical protein